MSKRNVLSVFAYVLGLRLRLSASRGQLKKVALLNFLFSFADKLNPLSPF